MGQAVPDKYFEDLKFLGLDRSTMGLYFHSANNPIVPQSKPQKISKHTKLLLAEGNFTGLRFWSKSFSKQVVISSTLFFPWNEKRTICRSEFLYFRRLSGIVIKTFFTYNDCTNFSNKVPANSRDIRFRSLQAFYFQKVAFW